VTVRSIDVAELPEGWLLPAEARVLAELAFGVDVLELGAYKGRSTVAMARTARRVFSVDWHHGDTGTGEADTLAEFMANIALAKNVVPIVGSFRDVLPFLMPAAFHLVFIDGAHDYDSVVTDAEWAELMVAPSGYIAAHDYSDGHPGCMQALDRTLGEPSRVTGTLAVYNR
jgi:predicted O-methyltransferase YrrM